MKLGEVATSIEDGDWIESKDQSPYGIRLVQTGNIGEGIFKDKTEKARYISEETFKRLHCNEIVEGDILVSRLPEPVGRACLLPNIGIRCITAVDCSIIRLKTSILMPELFVYYSISKQYNTKVVSKCTGTTRQRISRKNLTEIQIPVPPLSEQASIVSFLDAEFAKLDALKRNAEESLSEAKALFQSALKQLLTPQDGWVMKTLPEISENLDYKRIPVTQSNRISGIYPYYGASGIVDYVDDYIFDEELLLISEDGANLLARTYPIAFSISGKTWVNNHAHILRFNDRSLQKFVEYYFASIRLEEYVSGMAQPKLNQKSMNKIPIPVPPTKKQREIVGKLDKLSELCQTLQQNQTEIIRQCDDMKQALLRQVFE